MKVAIVFVALVAACSAMSLKEQVLQQVENAQMARRGESESGDEDDWIFSVMLEYVNLDNLLFQSPPWSEDARLSIISSLSQEGDGKEQDDALEELSYHFYLMQCGNLMAEVQFMKFIGFNDNEKTDLTSKLLIHGKTLFTECREMFGDDESEADKLDEALDDTKVDSRSESLRNLVRQLKLALRK